MVIFQVGFSHVEGVSNEKGKGEEYVSIGIHPLIKVFSVGEKVCNGVGMSRDVLELVVEVLKEFHPLGLLACNLLQLLEVLQVFVVSSDHNWVVSSKEVWSTTFKSIYDGHHFFVVYVVVLFCRE